MVLVVVVRVLMMAVEYTVDVVLRSTSVMLDDTVDVFDFAMMSLVVVVVMILYSW